MASAILKLAILGDAKSAQQALGSVAGDAEQSQGRIAGAFKKIGGAIAAYFTVTKIVDFARQSIKASMDLSKQLGATSNIFGANASAVESWSKTSSTALGLSQTNALLAANGFGTLGAAAGITGKDLATFGTSLTQRAVDIAAFYKKPPDDVIAALQSGLKGATKPLKQFGIMVDSNTLKQRALRMGLIQTDTQALTPQQKTLAMHAEILAQTAKTQDSFANSSNSLGKQQRILGAMFENLKATVGNALVPALTEAMTAFMGIVRWMNRNREVVAALAVALGAIFAAYAIGNQAISIGTMATKAWAAAQAVFNAVMSANPIMLVVAAVALLVAGFIYAYKNSETFRRIVQAAFNGVKVAAQAVANFFTQTIPGAFNVVWTSIRKVWARVYGFMKKWGPLALAVLVPFIGIPLLIYRNFSKIIGWLRSVWARVTSGIKDLVSRAGTILRRIWDVVTAPFKRAWTWVRSTVSGWASAVAGWMRNIVSRISSALSSVYDKVTSPFRRAWDAVHSMISNVGGWFSGIAGSIGSALSGVFNTIISPFRDAWNWIQSNVIGPIRSGWNNIASAINAVGDWSVSIPSWVPIIGGKKFSLPFPNIPTLARGGYFTTPTFAQVGEAGAEWVLPDAKLRALLRAELANLGPTVVVNGALDPDAVARQIERILVQRQRRVGGVRPLATA